MFVELEERRPGRRHNRAPLGGVSMLMITAAVMVKVPAATQQPSADDIDDQADAGDWNGLREVNGYWLEQP